MHRRGAVALIGKPNAGKSTLLNRLAGRKLSIVSDKAQTTRWRVAGMVTGPGFQIEIIDTPGVHEPHTHLGKLLNEQAEAALAHADLVVAVLDSSKPPNEDDAAIARLLQRASWPVERLILCLNKMDLLKAPLVALHVDAYTELFGTEAHMFTCLTKDQNVDKLLDLVVARLPEGEPLPVGDERPGQPLRRMAAELVREKALRQTRQEVPHALATVVDQWEADPATQLLRIGVSLVVEKEGQKAILIGRGGAMLRRIGTEARQEIEELTGRRVYLQLFVKVRPDWRQNLRMLRDLELLD
jgi:GTP-binding protein Era